MKMARSKVQIPGFGKGLFCYNGAHAFLFEGATAIPIWQKPTEIKWPIGRWMYLKEPFQATTPLNFRFAGETEFGLQTDEDWIGAAGCCRWMSRGVAKIVRIEETTLGDVKNRLGSDGFEKLTGLGMGDFAIHLRLSHPGFQDGDIPMWFAHIEVVEGSGEPGFAQSWGLENQQMLQETQAPKAHPNRNQRRKRGSTGQENAQIAQMQAQIDRLEALVSRQSE